MRESITESLLVPCNKSENYDENDKNVTGNNEPKYLSLSPWIVEILQSRKTGRKFLVRGLIQITHAKPDAGTGRQCPGFLNWKRIGTSTED